MISNINLKNIKSQFFGINLHLLYKSLSRLGISFKKLYVNNNKLNLSLSDFNNLINYIEVSFIINALLKDKIFINIRKFIY